MSVATITLIPRTGSEAVQEDIQRRLDALHIPDPAIFLQYSLSGVLGKNPELHQIAELIQSAYANVTKLSGQLVVLDEGVAKGLLTLAHLSKLAYVRMVQWKLRDLVDQGELQPDHTVLINMGNPLTVSLVIEYGDGFEMADDIRLPKVTLAFDEQDLVRFHQEVSSLPMQSDSPELLPFTVRDLLAVDTELVDQVSGQLGI